MNDTRAQYFVNQFASRSLRYEGALTVLRPLSEGLALFAELDVYPGEEGPRSLVAFVTDFMGGLFYPRSVAYDLNAVKLQVARLSAVEQRASLLAMPLTAEAGGYLLGYVLIKLLWRTAAQHDSFFADPDKFLLFCLGLLFSDYRLVLEIMDIPDSESEFRSGVHARRIASHALNSLRGFFDNPTLSTERQRILKGMEDMRSNQRTLHSAGVQRISVDDETLDPIGSLFGSEASVESGQRLLGQWAEWQNNAEPTIQARLPRALLNAQNATFRARHVLRLMSIPGTFSISQNRASIRGDGFYFESEVKSTATLSGNGSIELLFSYPDFYCPVLVAENESVPLLSYARGLNADRLQEILEFVRALNTHLEQARSMSEWMEDTKRAILPAEAWKKMEGDNQNATTEVFMSYAASQLAPSRRNAFAQATAVDGFLGIFQDVPSIQLLALISTLCVFEQPLSHFSDGLERAGFDLSEVHDLNERYRSVCGIDLVSTSDRVSALI